MWRGKRVGAAFLALSGALLAGCDEGCDPETVRRASDFIDSHLRCMTNADCVTVPDFCGVLPVGSCGKIPMNRAGAQSPEWRSMSYELADCAPEDCPVCDGTPPPTCMAGSCRLQ